MVPQSSGNKIREFDNKFLKHSMKHFELTTIQGRLNFQLTLFH